MSSSIVISGKKLFTKCRQFYPIVSFKKMAQAALPFIA